MVKEIKIDEIIDWSKAEKKLTKNNTILFQQQDNGSIKAIIDFTPGEIIETKTSKETGYQITDESKIYKFAENPKTKNIIRCIMSNAKDATAYPHKAEFDSIKFAKIFDHLRLNHKSYEAQKISARWGGVATVIVFTLIGLALLIFVLSKFGGKLGIKETGNVAKTTTLPLLYLIRNRWNT